MAALKQLSPTTRAALTSSRVTAIFETKLLYLFRGRNAWHSTWVTHYTDGCMHDQIGSARERAEKLREPGSVFTIIEQPALAIQTEVGTALITEINTDTPLSLWTRGHRKATAPFKLNPDYCNLERLVSPASTAGSLLSALNDQEIFRHSLPARSKNTFVLQSVQNGLPVENRRRRLKMWRSFAQGTDFYLGWNESAASRSGKAVRRVADALAPLVQADK